MYLVVTTVVLLVVSFLISKYVENKKYRDIHKIPGPPTVPFYGNSKCFGSTNAEYFQSQLALIKKYGKFIRIWIGSKLTILICDADKLEYFLTSNEHISKSTGYDGYKLWLGDGLINSTGDHWRKHRKIITPTFHFKVLEEFTEYINSNSKVLIAKLKEQVGKKSVNIQPFINYYNLDVISETAMRTKINAQEDPKSEYIKALKGYLMIYMSRFVSVLKQYDCFFKLTSDYKMQQEYVKTLKNFTKSVVDARKKERINTKTENTPDEFGRKKKTAFLDLLLDLQHENALSDEEIRQEVDTFMFAGHDTVTSSTTFGLHELSKHIDIQERLIDEFDAVLGDDKNVDITLQHIQEMKYLDLVVKEIMRFQTPVPYIERELNSDITLDGIFIPKGTTIAFQLYALHRMPEYFPEPDKFDPERFLPENCKERHPFVYIPFSAGPRNCIGQKYAMLSTKATIIKILRNFEVLPAEPKFEPHLVNSAVLESENGCCVQLKLRK